MASDARAPVGGALVRAVGLGVNLAIQILLASQLPAEEYAVVAVGISVTTIWSIVSALGLDSLGSREIGGNDGEPGFALEWWRAANRTLRAKAPFCALGYAAVVGALSPLGAAFRPADLLLLGLSVPALSVLRVLEDVARGSRRTIHASAWLNTVTPLVWMLAVMGTRLVAGDLTVRWVVATRVISATVVAGLAVGTLGHSLRSRARSVTSRSALSLQVAVPWGLLVLAIVATGTSQLDTVLAGAILDAEEAGSYALTARLASGMTIILFGVNLVAAPAIAAGSRRDELGQVEARLGGLLRRAVPLAALMACGIAAGTVLFIGRLREGYELSLASMGLLLGGQVVSVAFGPVGVALKMTSDEWSAVRSRLASMALQIAASIGAGVATGQAGVAFGTLVGLLAWNYIMARRVRDRLGVGLHWSPRSRG